jgi:hypothetical protein
MTLEIAVNAKIPVASNLQSRATLRQRRIASYRPSLYMTPESVFVQADASNNLTAWHPSLGGGRFSPTSAPVQVADEGAGLKSLIFTDTHGQALRDELGLDRLPESGQPCTIAMLIKQASGAGNFGGGVLGSPTPSYGSDMLAAYVDRTFGNANLQTQFGVGGQSMFSSVAANDGGWHRIFLTYLGTGPGGQIIQDGTAQGLSTDTYALSSHPSAREVQIGNYGPIGTDPFEGRIGAIAIFPVWIGNGANAELFTDLDAEFADYQTPLNS